VIRSERGPPFPKRAPGLMGSRMVSGYGVIHFLPHSIRVKMELALPSADVRRIVASGKLAVILGIESGFDQGGDLDILRLW
jgi:hypothetical protein